MKNERLEALEELLLEQADRIAELEAANETFRKGWESVKANRDEAWAEVDRLRGLIDHAAIELMRHAGENHNANLAHYLRGELNNRDGAEPAEAGEGESE